MFLEDDLAGPKDVAWGQQLRMTQDTLESIGLNLRWDVSDSFGDRVRRSHVSAKSDPNGPNGQTSYDFGTGAHSIVAHTLNLNGGFPVQRYTYDDSYHNADIPLNNAGAPYLSQNDNGIIDVGDVSSSVGRTSLQRQNMDIDQFRLEGDFDLSD